MNYNSVFAPTARASRFIKGHAANAPTYLLIAAVVILQASIAVINWVQTELDKAPEYAIRFQLAQIKGKRFFIRQLIKVARFDERYQVSAKASKAMDKVFCLG